MNIKTVHIIFLLLLCFCKAKSQGNYNPFQYGGMPTQMQAPTAPSWQQIHTQQQQQIQQQNNQQMINMGSTPPPTQTQIKAGWQPNNIQQIRMLEIEKILEEVDTKTSWSKMTSSFSNNQANFLVQQKAFEGAFQNLNNMLSGKQKMSVANAYYYLESTLNNDYFSSITEYKTLIKQSADFIKTWMKQHKYSIANKEQVHTAIQKFMSENLTTTTTTGTVETGLSVKTVTHAPFFYDYNDYEAKIDCRNAFATKCWATGGGQCAGMPVVYLSLAEALGVKTYLSYAPYHSFIKYLDNTGKIQNYEPTSNWKITDSWYQQNMFISAKAKATGIYLDTLNTQQIIANCMVDLALHYMRTLHDPNDSFVLKCLYRANDFFPKKNNLETYLVMSEYLANKLMNVLKKHKADKSKIAQIPEALSVFREMVANEDYIKALGYEEMPKGMYDEMLNEHAMKGKIQIAKGIEGKQKRNLFSKQ